MEDKLRVSSVMIALALAACHPPTARSEGAPPPPAAPQGPVNPDAGVTTYKCVDGSTIVAGYPDRDTAVVTYRDHAYTLKRGASSGATRYTGYGLQWSTKGAHASIASLKPGEDTATGPGVDCTAQFQPATATKTSFRPSSP